MSYTDDWKETKPFGIESPTLFPAFVRALRVDISERMATILAGIGNWTADPISIGNTKHELLHWSEFKALVPARFGQQHVGTAGYWDTLYNNGARIVGNGARTFYAPVNLPAGLTINELQLSGVTAANTSIIGTLYQLDTSVTPMVRTTLASVTVAASTAQGNHAFSAVSHVTSPSKVLWLEVVVTNTNVGSANHAFHGVRIRYSVPALLIYA